MFSREQPFDDVVRQRVPLFLGNFVPPGGLGGVGYRPDPELHPACELERRRGVALRTPRGERAEFGVTRPARLSSSCSRGATLGVQNR